MADFEDDDVFTFETCITVNENLINVAPFYFEKKKGVKLRSTVYCEWAPPYI